jgi:antitoxin ParD1/3/4
MSYITVMASRSSNPVTITLGDMRDRAEARVRSGAYASISEVVRAGLRALEREEATLDLILKAKVEEALSDPRPSVPLEEGMAELRRYAAARRAVR